MLTFDSVSKDLVAAGTSADLDHPAGRRPLVNLKQPGQIAKLTDVNGDVLAGQAAREDRRGHLYIVHRQHEGAWAGS